MLSVLGLEFITRHCLPFLCEFIKCFLQSTGRSKVPNMEGSRTSHQGSKRVNKNANEETLSTKGDVGGSNGDENENMSIKELKKLLSSMKIKLVLSEEQISRITGTECAFLEPSMTPCILSGFSVDNIGSVYSFLTKCTRMRAYVHYFSTPPAELPPEIIQTLEKQEVICKALSQTSKIRKDLKKYDEDNVVFITIDELTNIVSDRLGVIIGEKLLQRMMKDVGSNHGDGLIDYGQFCSLLTKIFMQQKHRRVPKN